jgi:quercetin dioxygenase-like cupin family protein
MPIIRREFLRLSGVGIVAPSIVNIALAQAQAGPKLTQILRNDLEGQNQVVQETVVSIVEFPPGATAPWHIHPGAQELLHVIEGSLVIEVEAREAVSSRPGKLASFPLNWSTSRAMTMRASLAKPWWCIAGPQKTSR